MDVLKPKPTNGIKLKFKFDEETGGRNTSSQNTDSPNQSTLSTNSGNITTTSPSERGENQSDSSSSLRSGSVATEPENNTANRQEFSRTPKSKAKKNTAKSTGVTKRKARPSRRTENIESPPQTAQDAAVDPVDEGLDNEAEQEQTEEDLATELIPVPTDHPDADL